LTDPAQGTPLSSSGDKPANRQARLAAFLAEAGWGRADRQHLAGDASDRRYERLHLGSATTVLMDNAPGGADDPGAFARMAAHLRDLGLSAPKVLAQDLDQGFLLLEDLGDDLFARLLQVDPARETALCAAAVDVLSHLQGRPAPAGLPALTAADWAEAAVFALDWYAFAATGRKPDPAAFRATLGKALRTHADGPRVLILRDFHADNLLWLPDRTGPGRVGLLDFQLGQMGQPGYDLVSLLQDARRDVAPATEAAMIARFTAASGADPGAFGAAYATLGAQRALRILGVFARLCLVAGKPGYLALIPRVWGQLQRNLAHPALADLRTICDAVLPEPTPELLQVIARQCPPSPSR
jgi:aminoglycoside/choline kinase family phosphotransferase